MCWACVVSIGHPTPKGLGALPTFPALESAVLAYIENTRVGGGGVLGGDCTQHWKLNVSNARFGAKVPRIC